MKVHLFGAASSPGCSNFGLKHLAAEGQDKFDPGTVKFIQNNFYVDDGLVSVMSEAEAIKLVKEARELCSTASSSLCCVSSINCSTDHLTLGHTDTQPQRVSFGQQAKPERQEGDTLFYLRLTVPGSGSASILTDSISRWIRASLTLKAIKAVKARLDLDLLQKRPALRDT
ncbi:hypothetical protein SRHO_G00194020 [Serrasalmus rhombeus]